MPKQEPDYRRIMAHLRGRIEAGDLKPGQRIGTYQELAAEYGVGMTTVRTALQMLGELGWLVGHQGKATYVAQDPPVGR